MAQEIISESNLFWSFLILEHSLALYLGSNGSYKGIKGLKRLGK